jgi:hypothetical protein
MEWWWLVIVLGLAGLLVLVWGWRRLMSFGRDVQVERARELFVLQRERLEARFVSAAQATGKPRGLRWKDCSFESDLHLARDRMSGELVGLVPVTIRFEAIEGGDMEGVPAVAHAKSASAVFFLQRGHWLTAGKAIFNLNPEEALRRFQDRYEPVEIR